MCACTEARTHDPKIKSRTPIPLSYQGHVKLMLNIQDTNMQNARFARAGKIRSFNEEIIDKLVYYRKLSESVIWIHVLPEQRKKTLLFISYKFVKGFLAVTFFITCFFELKLSWCVSTFFIQPET